MKSLPIYAIENELVSKLKSAGTVLLSSPTGSGKSTQVPQILLDNAICNKVLVLQPRRLATLMLATRVAEERQTALGKEVGYITRFDSKMSAETKICFATSGILLRMLLDDRYLTQWDTVIFDEFHERSCQQDIGLGMIKDLLKRRENLKLVVMSATLNSTILQPYLPDAVSLSSEGKCFPVDISYLPAKSGQAVWENAKKALIELLNTQPEGDILVFMPGAFEIHRTIAEFKKITTKQKLEFLPLYSSLSHDQQTTIMHPNQTRRVIVSTNIAETSMTIPRVKHVIDSGLAKVNRFHPAKGLNSLETESISDFSATQRSGRAGRIAPGSCIRLWRQKVQENSELEPEILRVDLSEALLTTASLGYQFPDSFAWLTPPKDASIAVATDLLKQLKLIDDAGKLTVEGAAASAMPLHPRFSKMIIESELYDAVPEAALTAALLAERPLLLTGSNRLRKLASFFDNQGTSMARRKNRIRVSLESDSNLSSDIAILIQAIKVVREHKFSMESCEKFGINRSAAINIWRSFEHIMGTVKRQQIDVRRSGSLLGLTKSILTAFSDRLCCRRDNSSLVCFTAGERATLSPESVTTDAPIFISTEIRKDRHGKNILCGNVGISEPILAEVFPHYLDISEEIFWHEVNQRVEKHHVVRYLDVKVEDKVVQDSTLKEISGKILAENIIKRKLVLNGWNKAVKDWISRVRWVANTFPEQGLITYDFEEYQCLLEEFCYGETSYQKVKNKPIIDYVKNLMSYADIQFIEKMAPERIELPNKRKLRIKYRPDSQPRGSARIQELFGVVSLPVLAEGRGKILLDILGPNMRPVQTTEDLNSFWTNLYPKIKPQLSRRYPKHRWE